MVRSLASGSNALPNIQSSKTRTFDADPDTDLVLRENVLNGTHSCQHPQDFDDQPSWHTLARDREKWTEVCLLADHELVGRARIEKRQKIASKATAKTFRLNKDAAIWSLNY